MPKNTFWTIPTNKPVSITPASKHSKVTEGYQELWSDTRRGSWSDKELCLRHRPVFDLSHHHIRFTHRIISAVRLTWYHFYLPIYGIPVSWFVSLKYPVNEESSVVRHNWALKIACQIRWIVGGKPHFKPECLHFSVFGWHTLKFTFVWERDTFCGTTFLTVFTACLWGKQLTALLFASLSFGCPPNLAFSLTVTGLYASGITSIGTPLSQLSPRFAEFFLKTNTCKYLCTSIGTQVWYEPNRIQVNQ